MNKRQNDTDHSVNDNAGKRNEDEGVLERIAKTIAPPSREVSDAELVDPGANSPAPKPATPAERAEVEQRQKNK
jgi:hypothetical protein